MNQIIEMQADETQKKQALGKLEKTTLSESRKRKVANIIKNSKFSGIYCDYFLAENPDNFKDNLESNKQFVRESEECGIKTEVYEAGINDLGICVSVDTNERFSTERIIKRATEFFNILENFYTGVRDSLQKTAKIDFGDAYGILWDHATENLEAGINDYIEGLTDYNLKDLDKFIYDSLKREFEILSKEPKYSRVLQMVKEDGEEKTLNEVEEDFSLIDKAVRELKPSIEESITKARSTGFESSFSQRFQEIWPLFNVYLKNKQITAQNLIDLLPEKSNNLRNNKLKQILQTGIQNFKDLTAQYLTQNSYLETEESIEPQQDKLESLEEHLSPYKCLDSSKYKNTSELRYFVKKEKLDPLNITWANDGGCCISVGDDEKNLGGGKWMPVYLLDKGVSVFGVYSQKNKADPKRVGMVLGFTTIDLDNNPVLLCNSYEFSEAYNPLGESGFNKVTSHLTDYLQEFARRAGFKRVAIGNHEHNTGINYMDKSRLVTPNYKEDELLKLPDKNIPQGFSEVLEDNRSMAGQWAYVGE